MDKENTTKVIVVKYNKKFLKEAFKRKKENIKYLGGNEFFIPNKRDYYG